MTLSRRERRKKARGRGKYSLLIPVGLCVIALVGALALYSSGYAGVLISRTRGRLEAGFPGNGPGEAEPGLQPGDGEPQNHSGGKPDDSARVVTGSGSGEAPEGDPQGASGDTIDGPGDEPAVPLDDGELSRLGVNELGKVPIIMYHDVQDYEAEWVRSRSNLRNDLERFHNLGYSLVLLSDYLSGNIKVPAGRAPLVLTFDDGTRGQFRMIESDEGLIPDPDCAVGILLEFSRTHPEFGHAATFFVNSGNPFGDASRVKEHLTFLLENGMEIGNHTRTHANLAYASPEAVVREIGSLVNEMRGICGYEPVSLALPFGGYPRSTESLLAGTWDDQEYVNKGILLVGAEPAPSPFSRKFNPLAIPRIRGSQEELDKWLGEFEKYPDERFVSDGRSETVTIRQGRSADLEPERVLDLEVREYPCDMDSVVP
jgi:peptidoglycan/xylan/chitin deacetylase (PgdA/CDA1 family)